MAAHPSRKVSTIVHIESPESPGAADFADMPGTSSSSRLAPSLVDNNNKKQLIDDVDDNVVIAMRPSRSLDELAPEKLGDKLIPDDEVEGTGGGGGGRRFLRRKDKKERKEERGRKEKKRGSKVTSNQVGPSQRTPNNGISEMKVI